MFEHPFVGDLSSKTTEELTDVISLLNKHLAFVYRTNNQAMINQLNMALNTYRAEYQKRQEEIWNKKAADFKGKIDIS